jgi:hypothetical protein
MAKRDTTHEVLTDLQAAMQSVDEGENPFVEGSDFRNAEPGEMTIADRIEYSRLFSPEQTRFGAIPATDHDTLEAELAAGVAVAVGLPDDNPKTAMGLKKPSTASIPPLAVLELGAVTANGAAKYGRFNWREKGVTTSIYTDAIDRHMLAYRDGETRDRESGLPHLAHVMACCAILLDAASLGQLHDDRDTGMAPQWIADRTKA